MSPGAPEKLGAPVLLETLALYSHMTFENAKVAKNGKWAFFSNLTDSKMIFFCTEIDENEIQNCKSLEQNKNSLFLVFAAVNK